MIKHSSLCAVFLLMARWVMAQTTQPFDGRAWNISTGNLSVYFIQSSPVGAFPKPAIIEPPPTVESLVAMKRRGLVADEDYLAWGALEREPGKWDFSEHDAIEKSLHAAGMKYVVYDWVHFPPVWLRDGQKQNRTLMKCLEHGEETNYLSIFDPRTAEWYDHFYSAVHAHFGDKVDDIYACILGPYGEGNYPLRVPDWINMGHCHEGYWCGDEYALRAFREAMRIKYGDISKLNQSWGKAYTSFDDVAMPAEVSGTDKYKITPALFPSAPDKRRWLDFITWYHQAIVDFAEQSYKALAKYYPTEKIRMKPGGTAGGINPIAWGTYSPAYAKMAGKYPGLTLQPADCQGAVFADKWLATAYAFYGVRLATEPASALSRNDFVRRMFSDASCGAEQFFTYEFDQHVPEIQKYVRLYIGHAGETRIALLCPTTLYRLGGNLAPTISSAKKLRDLCDFDVLDELLIEDGALSRARYDVLLIAQGDIVDQPILEKLDGFLRAGGRIVLIGDAPVKDVDGNAWPSAQSLPRTAPLGAKNHQWLTDLAPMLKEIPGCDGKLDGLWTTRRGKQVMILNPGDQPIDTTIGEHTVTIEPHSIWTNE
jgi:hypothetical protein